MILVTHNITKNQPKARVIGTSGSKKENRGSVLIYPKTRCIKTSEVHELMMTDEDNVSPGKSFERSGILRFIEISDDGLII